MTRQELLAELHRCLVLSDCDRSDQADPEAAHEDADMTLLEYIGDPEVTAVFKAIVRWYS